MSFLEMLFWIIVLTMLITMSKYTAMMIDVVLCATMKFVSYFSFIITAPMAYVLSDYTKRLLVLGSLMGHIVKSSPDTLDPIVMKHISELNERLHLVKGEERALTFPVLLHNHVWGETDIPACDVDAVLNRIPKFLRYGSETTMRHDIEEVLGLSYSW